MTSVNTVDVMKSCFTKDYTRKVINRSRANSLKYSRPVLVPLPWLPDFQQPMYMLHEDYLVDLPGGPRIKIDAGYTYDGATIWSKLGLTWAFSSTPFNSYVMRGALVHDVLCDLEPAYFNSKRAAELFHTHITEDGIQPGAAWRMRKAVELFGPKWGLEGSLL